MTESQRSGHRFLERNPASGLKRIWWSIVQMSVNPQPLLDLPDRAWLLVSREPGERRTQRVVE